MKARYWIPMAIILGGITGATSLMGLPRFTAEAEQKCNLCHVSPTGGGMRNGFGAQFFAQTELASHKTSMMELDNLQPQVSKTVSIGTDMRMMYFYDESSEVSSFFQMEGNLYASAQLDKRYSVTISKGIYNGFEVFGLGYILPAHGYFRVGKFQPAYGWRFDDHTSFVREKMLWPAGYTDTGIEFGIYPKGVSANVGFFNGTNGTLDNGKGKAVSSRLEIRQHVGKLGLGIGGSYYTSDNPSGDKTMYGPLYYLKLEKLIYQGEVDWLEDKTIVPSEVTTMALSHKLAYTPWQGVWFELSHDLYDPDIDSKTGSISRYGLGANYFPYAFLEFSPTLFYYDDTTVSDDKYALFSTQFHFFF